MRSDFILEVSLPVALALKSIMNATFSHCIVPERKVLSAHSILKHGNGWNGQ